MFNEHDTVCDKLIIQQKQNTVDNHYINNHVLIQSMWSLYFNWSSTAD